MVANAKFKKTVLDDGLTIISEADSSLYSASIGIWVKSGSRDEDVNENGLSHFIEHMLFKGTKSRSCLDIARQIDAFGGSLNAFTTRETTCYYAKVLNDHLDMAVDILCDILLNSLFNGDDMEKERQVILQEIRMTTDTPEDEIHDLFYKTFWQGHPLSRPITGDAERVSSFSREQLLNFFTRTYSPGNMVVAVSGDVSHDRIVGSFEEAFASLPQPNETDSNHEVSFASNIDLYPKDLEQVQICLGTTGISTTSPKRHAAYILNTLLGGGMSSRLFQKIREEMGLAYSIYSYLSTYRDTGLFGVYAATGEESVTEVLEQTVCELKRLKDDLIPEEELTSAKEQLKSHVLFSLETSDSRMQKIAGDELAFGRYIPSGEVIKEIESVSSEDVNALARELFCESSLNLTLLGPFDESKVMAKVEDLRGTLGN